MQRPDARIRRHFYIHLSGNLHGHISLFVPFPPFLHQRCQGLKWIIRLQQWSISSLDALHDRLGIHVDVHHQPRLQLAPILIPHHQSTPRGDYASHVSVDAIEDLRLDVPKRRFALLLEYLRDGHTRGTFEDCIGVEEVVGAHAAGYGVAHGGFAAAHHSDEVEVAALEARGEETGRVNFEGRRSLFAIVCGFEEVGIFEWIFDTWISLVGRRIFPLEAPG
mmetsp:Transcript_5639/g.10323  ORF Transcript_5639/g.10323 Transcript_5639/m.10323 type:complete len:221 (+) Transcript_5639:420-1082(+)